MFCDIVGSTALTARLDLEDLQELMGVYQRRVAEVVTPLGGFIARRLGDALLIYFGYPRVNEDDPEQAVRAGLAVIEAVVRLDGPEPLQVRIGIATGMVVVTYLTEAGNVQDQEVLGEGPNLAARLQGLAEPNTIVIADSTRGLVGSVFELEDLGLKALKGLSKPQRAWRVLGESPLKGRFEALRSIDSPLVGRGEEIDLLLRRWEQAKAGEGRVILLSGEPGIGKSRLTVALTDRLHDKPHVCLRYFCLPHHQDSALFPIILQLERTAGFGRDDTPAGKLDKLDALLSATLATDPEKALLAELLLLPTGRYPVLDVNPRRKKEMTFEALLRQFSGLAAQKPALIIFEDMHWVDPTTLELLNLMVKLIERLPALLIATFRPEFKPPWVGQPHVTMLTLNRFSRSEGATLVRQLVGKATSLSNELVTEIVERTDGVPLFLEEVTKAVVQTGAKPFTAAPPMWQPPGGTLSVPPTLHASLMTRLDRLGAMAKEIAQIGAAIGREFSYDLLAAVAQHPEPELKEQLGGLVAAGLMLENGAPPRSSYVFNHALVQDAAYNTLLRAPRRTLHARIAQAIEKLFSNATEGQPELVARHLSEAGLLERATVYWQRAGELALRRSAVGEAVTHLSTALRIMETLPDAPERAVRELAVRLGLGTAGNIARGSADPDVAKHYARAVVLSRAVGDDKQLFRAVWGSWYTNLTTGQTEQALPLANELVAVAQRLADQALILEAHHSRWATSHVLGLNAATLADTERGIAIYTEERHHAHTYDFGGHDTGVCARAHNMMTLWITGFPDQAARMSVAALDLGHRLGHPPSLAHAAWWSATLRQFLREPQACRELAEIAMRIAREQNSKIFVMWPVLMGWAVFESGNVSEGLDQMEQAVTAARKWVRRFYFEHELLVFAQALLKGGEFERALEVTEEALNFITTSRNHLFEAEACRLKSACLAAIGGEQAAEVEPWLLRAIETSERQGALSFKLRAVTDLARLWRDQGRSCAARNALSPVYERFTEGLDTPDLKDAKILLNDLEARCRKNEPLVPQQRPL
jgi:class 3 adenylate cyclase/predicted ATPase